MSTAHQCRQDGRMCHGLYHDDKLDSNHCHRVYLRTDAIVHLCVYRHPFLVSSLKSGPLLCLLRGGFRLGCHRSLSLRRRGLGRSLRGAIDSVQRHTHQMPVDEPAAKEQVSHEVRGLEEAPPPVGLQQHERSEAVPEKHNHVELHYHQTKGFHQGRVHQCHKLGVTLQ